MHKLIYDIDNTLTFNSNKYEYDQKPKSDFFDLNLHPSEFELCYYTARNMKTYKEDLGKICSFTVPTIQEWLINNGLPLKKIYYGKPYCGSRGVYIDDRAINVASHKLSLESGFINKKIYIIITLYNCYEQIENIILEFIELLTFCCNAQILLVDNASTDGTTEYCQSISDSYPSIDLLSLKENIGYGGACKYAINHFKASSFYESHDLLISHGNFKYSILDFIKYNAKMNLSKCICFTKRIGRSKTDYFISYILHLLFYIFRNNKIFDCLGAIRFIPNADFSFDDFINTPDDYTFDMWLSIRLSRNNNIITNIPVIENKFFIHKSSWNKSFFSKVHMVYSYICLLFKGNN